MHTYHWSHTDYDSCFTPSYTLITGLIQTLTLVSLPHSHLSLVSYRLWLLFYSLIHTYHWSHTVSDSCFTSSYTLITGLMQSMTFVSLPHSHLSLVSYSLWLLFHSLMHTYHWSHTDSCFTPSCTYHWSLTDSDSCFTPSYTLITGLMLTLTLVSLPHALITGLIQSLTFVSLPHTHLSLVSYRL